MHFLIIAILREITKEAVLELITGVAPDFIEVQIRNAAPVNLPIAKDCVTMRSLKAHWTGLQCNITCQEVLRFSAGFIEFTSAGYTGCGNV